MDNKIDISVSNLTIDYQLNDNKIRALDDVTFTVERGRMCCIVGPSGCGKSTLLRAILGLLSFSAGSVEINPDRLNGGIAYVQQDCPLLPWRTALQNACLGTEVKGKLNRDILRRVRRQFVDFNIHDFENSFTSELSGGMRQRVAIARALEGRPALLFCDEPFSAVDFVGRLALTSKFKYMCRVRGITTLFVTHNIEEAIFLGDVILVLSGRPGRIKNEYHPKLSIGNEDAVRCREAPEFNELFQQIWNELETKHA